MGRITTEHHDGTTVVEASGIVDEDLALELGAAIDDAKQRNTAVVVSVADAELSLAAWAVVERSQAKFARAGLGMYLLPDPHAEPPARVLAKTLLSALRDDEDDSGNGARGFSSR